MKSNDETAETGDEFTKPPFLYEIRVKGRLSSEQWMSWFDDLTVSTAKGESTLRGRAPDHAALYGLIARLRDLAVPLVAVKVLDAEAQLKLSQQSRRYDLTLNVLQVVIYLVLTGGLTSITVFVAPIINTALALALLFALLAGLAHALGFWSGQAREAWRWVAFVAWLAAAIAFLIYVPVSGVLPPAVGIGIMLILGAGGLLYLLYYLRRRAENIKDSLTQVPGRAAESVEADRAAEATEHDVTPMD